MTINQARAILNYIIKCKKQKMNNEQVIWLLANEFNIEEGSNDTQGNPTT